MKRGRHPPNLPVGFWIRLVYVCVCVCACVSVCVCTHRVTAGCSLWSGYQSGCVPALLCRLPVCLSLPLFFRFLLPLCLCLSLTFWLHRPVACVIRASSSGTTADHLSLTCLCSTPSLSSFLPPIFWQLLTGSIPAAGVHSLQEAGSHVTLSPDLCLYLRC